jgi:Type II secretion system (T2SS), protein F
MTALLQQPIFLLLTGTLGLGVFLLTAGPVLAYRRPDLVVRLRRLDPDIWWEDTEADAGLLLGPFGEDIGRLVVRVVGYLGFIAPRDLSRVLAQADLGLKARDFYQDKILTALGLEAILVVANLAFEKLGLLHAGVWPLWVWVVVGGLGFVWPDFIVRQGARDRQKRLRAELPRLVDMLLVASSTGRGVQDAIVDVGAVLTGPLAHEWLRLSSQLARGLREPLQELAARNGLRELDVLVGHLIVAYERGQGLEANLVQLSESLREQRLQDLTAEGGRATGTMFLPVVLLVYLPLLVVVMAPVAATLAGLLNS